MRIAFKSVKVKLIFFVDLIKKIAKYEVYTNISEIVRRNFNV